HQCPDRVGAAAVAARYRTATTAGDRCSGGTVESRSERGGVDGVDGASAGVFGQPPQLVSGTPVRQVLGADGLRAGGLGWASGRGERVEGAASARTRARRDVELVVDGGGALHAGDVHPVGLGGVRVAVGGFLELAVGVVDGEAHDAGAGPVGVVFGHDDAVRG